MDFDFFGGSNDAGANTSTGASNSVNAGDDEDWADFEGGHSAATAQPQQDAGWASAFTAPAMPLAGSTGGNGMMMMMMSGGISMGVGGQSWAGFQQNPVGGDLMFGVAAPASPAGHDPFFTAPAAGVQTQQFNSIPSQAQAVPDLFSAPVNNDQTGSAPGASTGVTSAPQNGLNQFSDPFADLIGTFVKSGCLGSFPSTCFRWSHLTSYLRRPG